MHNTHPVPAPEISLVAPPNEPTVGQDFDPKCVGSVPESVMGIITVLWFGPDNNLIVTNSSIDTACAVLEFVPLMASDVIIYCTCTCMHFKGSILQCFCIGFFTGDLHFTIYSFTTKFLWDLDNNTSRT